jgi:phosphoserine phosphatase
MRLIITRHGRSLGNENSIHEGHLPGELSEEGKKQVKKLAERLKDEKIDIIYSSDLKRASDTAKEIAKYHPNIPIHFTKELREVDVGDFTGKRYDETDWNNVPKNVETAEEVQKRVKRFLDKILKEHRNKSVLLVGHDYTDRALATVLFKESYKEREKYKFDNTSVSVFEIGDNNKVKIKILNSTEHLEIKK